jgi:hypothetical protein
LAGNPVLSPVTLSQFFAQVPKGGNEEPASRHLQAGSPGQVRRHHGRHGAPSGHGTRHLTSFSHAVGGHQHPAVFVELSDLLLATENRSFDPVRARRALAVFIQRFGVEVNLVSLAAQNTITFTSRTASIPVSVLSSAPFPVKVVLSLSSDKFAFPDGNARTLTLDHPTTPVRIEARSVTSGDRLPVEVTLTTPDGQLVIARAALTVHSTSISIVGIALTVLAALVLLVWWARTWRKGNAAGATAAGRMSTTSPPRRRPARPLPVHRGHLRRPGHGCLAPHRPVAHCGAGLGPRRGPPGRCLQPGQQHAQHALRHRRWAASSRPPSSRSSWSSSRAGRRTRPTASISAILSVSLVVLLGTTVIALVLAPEFITALTASIRAPTPTRSRNSPRTGRRHHAPALVRDPDRRLRALLPRTALLNTRRRFVAVAWGPIVNNVVCIVVLIWFGLWAGRHASLASVANHPGQLMLLGLGTSLGVVLQGVALIPSLRAANLRGLRWHWNLRDAALRTVIRLSGWTFGFVVANQIAVFVIILLAGTAAGTDPVSSYTYAYAFMQMPYGIVAVTVMSVVAPDLAQRWTSGDRSAFLARLPGGGAPCSP